jgi:biopolymer transport protein ExbB
MKGYVFVPILVIALLVSWAVWQFMLPQFVRDGGPVVIVLMTLSILVFTFVIERIITLKRAQGRYDVSKFTRSLKKSLDARQIAEAIEVCKRQGGSLANVVGAGLEQYRLSKEKDLKPDEVVDETKRAIEEANALETPLLERNLIALSTIASTGTMFGLFGTTIGMIRAFQAMGHAGAPDAVQLAVGISEALINTALGLFVAITGIIGHNYFTNRVDTCNYMMDETTYEMIQVLEHQKRSAGGSA